MDLQIEVKPTVQKPPTSLALAALALGLFSIPSTGCSFLGSYGPPPDYRQVESFDCTGYTLPVLDTIWAVCGAHVRNVGRATSLDFQGAV